MRFLSCGKRVCCSIFRYFYQYFDKLLALATSNGQSLTYLSIEVTVAEGVIDNDALAWQSHIDRAADVSQLVLAQDRRQHRRHMSQ